MPLKSHNDKMDFLEFFFLLNLAGGTLDHPFQKLGYDLKRKERDFNF